MRLESVLGKAVSDRDTHTHTHTEGADAFARKRLLGVLRGELSPLGCVFSF